MIVAPRSDTHNYLCRMELKAISQHGDDVIVRVLVVPNASASAVVGPHADRIRVRIAAPPERGRANAELCSLLSAATGARRAEIESGAINRKKIDKIEVSFAATGTATGIDADFGSTRWGRLYLAMKKTIFVAPIAGRRGAFIPGCGC